MSEVGAAVIAVGLAMCTPSLHRWLSGGIGRLVYGRRGSPAQIVAELIQRLARAAGPDDVLEALADSVSAAVQTNGVEIILYSGARELRRTAHGTSDNISGLVLPLRFQGTGLGQMRIQVPVPLDSSDRALLTELCDVAAGAVAAAHRSAELQLARESLVIARERERRRIGRDLHDGLGPVLSGVGFMVDALRERVRDLPEVEELVGDARAQIREASQLIRRVARELRPTAVDQLGLQQALHEMVAQHKSSGLRIALATDIEPHVLTPAVEVAAYAIAAEAITNVVRHAAATTCSLHLAFHDDVLIIRIDDNGSGVDHRPAGLGRVSMQERAEELGGTFQIGPSASGGCRVEAHNAFPGKDIWFTECSGWHGVNDSAPQVFADTLKWHAGNITVGTTRNWAKAVATWNLALNSQGGPVNGGCGNNPQGMCSGVLSIDGSTVTRNAEFYTLGHLSKFVRQGAIRVGSNNAGNVQSVAFRNPNGSIALVVTNTGAAAQAFAVSWNGQRISYTLPTGALATLTWNSQGQPAPDITAPTAPSGLQATGTTATSTTLSWTASTDAVGVTAYSIYRGGTKIGTTASTSYRATGLAATTTYRFTVTAADAAGNTSPAAAKSVTTAAVPAPLGIDPAAWYQVINTNSTRCLDAADWGNTNGTVLQQWSCAAPAADNELWQFRPTNDGFYRVLSRLSPGKSWDVIGGPGATSNGSLVQLWGYSGAANQQWKPALTAANIYSFSSRSGGQCLDVANVSKTDGARLQVWTCTGGAAQTYRLVARA